jgi:hypothetical protein
MPQYLDDSGEPITAGPDVTLPKGYALLSTKKSPKKTASVKELKLVASARKPVVPPSGYLLAPPPTSTPDFTSNEKGEGLYSMYGKTGKGDAVGEFKVPYSKVQSALAGGSTFLNGSDDVYAKDKAAEGKPVSWYQKIIQSPALAPVPHEQKGTFDNVDRAAARTILSTPAYAKQLFDAAKSMHEGNVAGGDEVANLLNPFQIPKQMIDQWREDAKTDPKMATDNLIGNAIGLGVVGAVTHGVTNKVGGAVGALRDKFTPVTEPPVRERTNVLHRNDAGEVRQAKGQAPSVWLSPAAWKSLMTELYPDENPAETHGFNLPADDAMNYLATQHQPETPNPAFSQVQELLAKAHAGAGEGGIVIGKNRPSIQANVNVMREELNHTWQRGLANGNVNQHLDPQAFTNLYHAIPSGMYDHLVDNGYSGHNSPEMVTEAAAKLMDGRPERFGVDQDDAVDFLDKYFKEVTAKHGAKALEELQHVRGIAADAKARAIEEHAGRTGGGQDNPTVPSVAAGGQGGAEKGVPSTGGEQVAPAADALFNREKEKPVWYLKSEKLIGEKMRGPMPGQDVSKMLIAGGVKPEEMHWTGLDDFLKTKGKDKVTPQEIKDHLAENNLQIKEVTKGAANIPKGQYLVFDEDDKIVGAEDTPRAAQRAAEAIGHGASWTDRDDHAGRHAIANAGGDTKYESYVLPGGENYREKLLTTPIDHESIDRGRANRIKELQDRLEEIKHMPSGDERERQWRNTSTQISMVERDIAQKRAASTFQSSHWDEPNPLAHIRYNDRTAPDGSKLLHLEEVQSDWHQKGRDKGYQGDKLETPEDAKNFFGIKDDDWAKMDDQQKQSYVEEMKSDEDYIRKGKKDRVPDAPFKKTWHEMALRRILQHAATNGYDGVSWTPRRGSGRKI